jgi:excinuclease UvrABC helicase subunit UvrB
MEKEMLDYAQNLEFEKAAVMRDSVEALRAELLELPV